MSENNKPLALYVHVPFCKSKCTYCDFYSIVGREGSTPEYLESITHEILHARDSLDLSKYYIDTIFFGGGTPNLLSPTQIETILTSLFKLARAGSDMEIGMEVNPGEATLDELRAYQSIGINRISVGVQSFQPELLRFMSRIHSVEESKKTLDNVRTAGFKNMSADLIFAVPGQTNEMWASDLQQLIEFNPEHISTYSLTVEEGTALKRWVDAGHVKMLEEVLDTDMYTQGRDFLESQGYGNYEISNFSKPGYACRHNLNYWTGVEYLGFGPAAHSYFNERRQWNVQDLDKYINNVAESGSGMAEDERIDSITARNEMILTRMRLSEGLDMKEYEAAFGKDILSEKQDVLKKWKHELNMIDGRLIVTRSGWALIDEISSDLMDVE